MILAKVRCVVVVEGGPILEGIRTNQITRNDLRDEGWRRCPEKYLTESDDLGMRNIAP